MSELPNQKAPLYRQHCRICGRTCSNSVGICDSPFCSVALVEKLEQQLAELQAKYAAQNAALTAIANNYCDGAQWFRDTAKAALKGVGDE